MNGKFSISLRLGCALLAAAFLVTVDSFTADAQTLPQITTARLKGKKLIVSGQAFEIGASILINGVEEKTKNSADNPTGELIAKKGRKRIGEDEIVTIHVVNPAGSASSAFRFFGGPTLTLADQGKTIDLKVGQQFLVALGGGYAWKVDFQELKNIVVVPTLLPIFGSQGLFEPIASGRVSFKAKGEPNCNKEEGGPCPQNPVDFEVTIAIE
jgi:hypothetical protein